VIRYVYIGGDLIVIGLEECSGWFTVIGYHDAQVIQKLIAFIQVNLSIFILDFIKSLL